jgi:hypothetical protein
MKRSLLKATTAWVVAAALLNPMGFSPAARAGAPATGPYGEPALTAAGAQGSVGAQYASDPDGQGRLDWRQKLALLRQKV